MKKDSCIASIHAREILDSRGNPTVEAEVRLENGISGVACVPSGASTGVNEALELRDDDKHRYGGKGVLKAVSHVNKNIAEALNGMDVLDQASLDKTMIKLDGTPAKDHLGANALLAVSLAALHAGAAFEKQPLYRYAGGVKACRMPVPMVNILNGGVHSDAPVDFQEFMIRPIGASSFSHGLQMTVEVFHTLKEILKLEGYSTAVGDEGGFAPEVGSTDEVFRLILAAIEKAGYKPGTVASGGDISIAIDCASSEFYDDVHGLYCYRKEGDGRVLTSSEQADYLCKLVQLYPIDSIEDGMSQGDWDGWLELRKKLPHTVQMVGDDLLVTNVKYIHKAISLRAADALLVKPNQVGTFTETAAAVEMAQEADWKTILSHRSGETADTTIADLAVAFASGQIKTGSVSRAERTCKYNRLLKIEEELGKSAEYYP